MVKRCRMILLRADGVRQQDVATQLAVNRPVVVHWEKRFRNGGGAMDSRRPDEAAANL